MERILQFGNRGEEHPSNESLLLYLDGELAPREAGHVRAHLEACWQCRSNAARMETAIAGFMEFEALRTGCGTPPSVERFRARLDRLAAEAPSPARGSAKWRLRLSMGGILAVAAISAVLLVIPRSTVHADAILKESALRERAWLHQPGKVLHWVDETDLQGNPNLPDGRYRTLRWQSNVSGRTGSLLRKYNLEGALVWARWDRPDGSEVVFDVRNADGILIYPTTAEMKEYAVRSGHPEWLRAEIRASEAGTTPELAMQETVDWFQRSVGLGRVEQLRLPESGLVFHIHSASDRLHAVLDHYISADTFRRVRLHSARFGPDGAIIATEDARMVLHRDSSIEEFDANDLRAEMARARHTIRILPEDLLKRTRSRSQKQPGAVTP